MAQKIDDFDKVLAQHLPEDALSEVRRILYGKPVETLAVSEEGSKLAEKHDFEIKSFKIPARDEQIRPARKVRIGAVQNSIILPTTDPLVDQRDAIFKKIGHLIDAAAAEGVNVLCLQEAWPCPFFFCTREKYPWTELAEDPETGPSAVFIKEYAKKYNMVIISSILERDATHQGILWNTAVVISNRGNYVGKHRKNHIPSVADFNESTYYRDGNTGHPVFETDFGKIAVNICYGRHHPLNWAMFALNGAEIIFNPSATVGDLSEPLWSIEARNAAIANGCFTVAINRVGTEVYPNEFTSGLGQPAHKDFGHFYGSSYVTAPNASRTPSLSRTRDGLLVTEVDLNMCSQIKDMWCFQMTQRLEMYGEKFTEAAKLDYKPQVIKEAL